MPSTSSYSRSSKGPPAEPKSILTRLMVATLSVTLTLIVKEGPSMVVSARLERSVINGSSLRCWLSLFWAFAADSGRARFHFPFQFKSWTFGGPCSLGSFFSMKKSRDWARPIRSLVQWATICFACSFAFSLGPAATEPTKRSKAATARVRRVILD